MLAEKSFDPFVILLPCSIHYGNTCKLEATEYECAAYIYVYIDDVIGHRKSSIVIS